MASPLRTLAALAALSHDYGPAAATRQLSLLRELGRRSLPNAAALSELHELLLYLRAYPGDARVARAADRELARFARRSDLRRFRGALEDSGIAGTEIRYPFFYPTALWLARRFPHALALDWENTADEEIRPLLTSVLSFAEAVWARDRAPGARALVRGLAPRRSDAVTLLERLAALPGDDFTREALHDRVAPFYRLAPARGTPNRSTARAPRAPLVVRRSPPRRDRPDLATELVLPPRAVREVRGHEAETLLTLARDAMVTRARDLDCFCYGDARDVRRIVHDDGLEFVAFGSLPERRLLLAAAYGLLTLRNGVPTGYVQLDAFLSTALVHFNTFETFRGADAAWVFARVLATARALFGSDAFAIEPYQLGHGNDEALDSGAWWFYRKLGFAPRDPATRRLARAEETKLRRRPAYRSPRTTLGQLARAHLFFEPFRRPAHVAPHAAISRAITAWIANLSGPAAEAPTRALETARSAIGLGRRRLTGHERLWLERWAPMFLALPGFDAWPRADRQGLAALVRLKAARRESALVPVLRSHPRFAPTLFALASRHADPAIP